MRIAGAILTVAVLAAAPARAASAQLSLPHAAWASVPSPVPTSVPPSAPRLDAQPQSQSQTQTQNPPLPPVSRDKLDRIRNAVETPPRLRIENGQLKIYVEVIAKWPSFADIVKDYDLMNGPTGKGGNPTSHAEFLGLVTPRNMYGSGGIQAGEVLTMALVNYFGQ
jgi:hypothetical protein